MLSFNVDASPVEARRKEDGAVVTLVDEGLPLLDCCAFGVPVTM
jgi:hypothetical protein